MTALLRRSAFAITTSYVSFEIMLDGRPFFGLTAVKLFDQPGRRLDDRRPNALYLYRSSMTCENVFLVSLCRFEMAMRAARMA